MRYKANILPHVALTVAIAALLVPDSFAQCANARQFGGLAGGKTASNVQVDTSGFQDNGNELAQFWLTGDPANGTGVGAAGTCDSQGPVPVGWWQVVGEGGGLRGIRGFVAQPGCTLPACPPPGASLTFLVEDQSADGSDAGFITYTVDETPAGERWWDLARTDPNAAPGSRLTQVMGSYPSVLIVASGGPPPNTTVTTNYEDVGLLFHGVQGPDNTPLPGSAQLSSYDVMVFHGPNDPGRARSHWTLVHKIPYQDADIVSDILEGPCSTTNEAAFFAIGLTWDGSVESELVGPASLPVACDPDVAQPDDSPPDVRRPSFTKRPGRSRQ